MSHILSRFLKWSVPSALIYGFGCPVAWVVAVFRDTDVRKSDGDSIKPANGADASALRAYALLIGALALRDVLPRGRVSLSVSQ